jgi:hypothetical protein
MYRQRRPGLDSFYLVGLGILASIEPFGAQSRIQIRRNVHRLVADGGRQADAALGSTRRSRQRSSVLLPDPDGPQYGEHPPAVTRKLTSSTMRRGASVPLPTSKVRPSAAILG